MKAFIFPEQESQYSAMGKGLDESNALVKELLGFLHSAIRYLCMGEDFKPGMVAANYNCHGQVLPSLVDKCR